VFQLGDGHLPRIEELMEHYAALPMDLADASLVVLAEETGSGQILSTDQRDFRTYRWKHRRPFRNLLLA
jgi:predicted nucleic acid-binding protein